MRLATVLRVDADRLYYGPNQSVDWLCVSPRNETLPKERIEGAYQVSEHIIMLQLSNERWWIVTLPHIEGELPQVDEVFDPPWLDTSCMERIG